MGVLCDLCRLPPLPSLGAGRMDDSGGMCVLLCEVLINLEYHLLPVLGHLSQPVFEYKVHCASPPVCPRSGGQYSPLWSVPPTLPCVYRKETH